MHKNALKRVREELKGLCTSEVVKGTGLSTMRVIIVIKNYKTLFRNPLTLHSKVCTSVLKL